MGGGDKVIKWRPLVVNVELLVFSLSLSYSGQAIELPNMADWSQELSRSILVLLFTPRLSAKLNIRTLYGQFHLNPRDLSLSLTNPLCQRHSTVESLRRIARQCWRWTLPLYFSSPVLYFEFWKRTCFASKIPIRGNRTPALFCPGTMNLCVYE